MTVALGDAAFCFKDDLHGADKGAIDQIDPMDDVNDKNYGLELHGEFEAGIERMRYFSQNDGDSPRNSLYRDFGYKWGIACKLAEKVSYAVERA